MNKRHLHHVWAKLKPISYWYFLIGFILSSVIAVWALRNNNLEMVRLREVVIAADKSGEGVNEALASLREHVYSHMNTDLTSGDNSIYPPIQLQQTYERLTKGEKDRIAAANQKVSDDAVAICEQRFGAGQLRDGRVQCVQDYITANSVKAAEEVPKELYQFAFVSPIWSPDLAGWSLVVSALFFLLLVVRFSLEKWLSHELREHS